VHDRSNTSLHLAVKLGFFTIVALLIDAGHEQDDISLNTDYETPLMLACEHKQIDAGALLIERFPRCIPWANKYGMDSVRSLSSFPMSVVV
jgi:ankyrin repeat protein